MNAIEFQKRIKKIMKNFEYQLRIKKIMKTNIEFHGRTTKIQNFRIPNENDENQESLEFKTNIKKIMQSYNST